MRQKITVLGSFVVDLMARTPHLPAAGETVRGSRFKQGAGGKGFNQGVAAHKAGGNVSMVTKLGHDALGQVALEAMDAVGMKKDFLFYSEDVETGVALILVDEHASQNEIVVVPGACATLSDEFLNGLFLVTPNEVDEGMIDDKKAVLMIEPRTLDTLLHPQFDAGRGPCPAGRA